jgi:hypothetical protein
VALGPGASHAGITVPMGNPGRLEQLGHSFAGLSGAVESSASSFRTLPVEMSTWQGAASVSFASAALEAGSGGDHAAASLSALSRAASGYARVLEDAQREAREAIDQAREAERRIRRAKELIADAQARHAAALLRAAAAEAEIFATSLVGNPSPGAEDARANAYAEAEAAADDDARARRLLDEAREDLEAAQRRGARAEREADEAGAEAARIFGAVAPGIALASLRAPAAGFGGGAAAPAMPPARPVGGGGGERRSGAGSFSGFGDLTPLVVAAAPWVLTAGGGAFSGYRSARRIPLGEAMKRAPVMAAAYVSAAWRDPGIGPHWLARGREQGAAAAAKAAGAQRTANALRWGARGSALLAPAGGFLQYKANEGEMSHEENVVRSVSTAGGEVVGGTLVGGLCAISGVGTWATVGCGTVGAVGGGFVGDKVVGPILYDLGAYEAGEWTYENVLEPIGDWAVADDPGPPQNDIFGLVSGTGGP